jgi:hydrogenase maturation protease
VQVLVIGCGNADRGDDAAGVLVARRLRERGVNAREHSGDGLALIESWNDAEYVILIDAAVTGAAAGTITGCIGADAVPLRESSTSTHGFGVAEGIELARALGRLPPMLKIYGIEGKDFTPGAAPSAAVLESVERVVNLVLMEVHRHEPGEPAI